MILKIKISNLLIVLGLMYGRRGLKAEDIL